MRTLPLLVSLLGACALCAGVPAAAQTTTCEYPRMLIVLDKSSSMLGTLASGSTKWSVARTAINRTVSANGSGIHFGLMIFPDPDHCGAGKVKVDVGPNTATAISSYLSDPPPSGGNYTPMSQSLDAAGEYAPLLSGPQRNFVLLITDGWQWCDPYDSATRFWPVDAVRRLRAKGVKTYVVGFGGGVDVLTLNRMAYEGGTSRSGCNPAGTDANALDRCYFQAGSQAELDAALDQIAVETGAERCDGRDNDCDGYVDNSTAGSPAPMSRACSSACGGGLQQCVGGQWTACNAPQPVAEACDGQDNNCDGFVDNAVAGSPAPLTRACQSACGTGIERCEGGRWVGCDAPAPAAETCDGRDEDCDGHTDNARTGDPAPLTRACSSACGSGVETCIRGQFQGCTAPPAWPEVCGNGIDDNCDGRVDEGCECQRGETRACGTNVGECAPGVQSCTTDGRWGDCQGGQQPGEEICDGLDNNCNGTLDDGARCAGDAVCACGGCARPCRNGECPQGSRCTGGYCVFDRCPPGMHCEGTACVPGEAPPAPDAGTPGPPPGAEEGPAPEEPVGGPPQGCGCASAGTSPFPFAALCAVATFVLLRRRRRVP
jgi:MYXO-CTERM domain-containing protein